MSGVNLGHSVTLDRVTKRGERLPNIGEAELGQLRKIAERKRVLVEQIHELEEQAKSVDGDLYQLAAQYRARFPGRGTMTMMADAIGDVLEAGLPDEQRSRSRRTMLSRAIGTINAYEKRSPKRLVLFPEDEK